MFNIDIENGEFIAQHEALTEAESVSEFIPVCSIVIDPDFSLDENLSELYNECYNAILNSDFFEISDEY